ncbi:MAG: hypothetical protein V7724_01085 [Sediminicola sp.]
MARIKSPSIITGTLGEIDFYVDVGSSSQGGRWGLQLQRYQDGPEMGSVGENGREFDHCSGINLPHRSICIYWK